MGKRPENAAGNGSQNPADENVKDQSGDQSETKAKSQSDIDFENAQAEKKARRDAEIAAAEKAAKAKEAPELTLAAAKKLVEKRYNVPPGIKKVFVTADENVFFGQGAESSANAHAKSKGIKMLTISWD